MRIWWQSSVDADQNEPYLECFARYLNEIADQGTEFEVQGMAPGDRRLAGCRSFGAQRSRSTTRSRRGLAASTASSSAISRTRPVRGAFRSHHPGRRPRRDVAPLGRALGRHIA